MMKHFAHSENRVLRKHLAKEHLASVAKLAQEFAINRAWKDEAILAGLLHDLGKYADLFQARLRGEEKGLDHWSLGAWVALTEYQAVAAALAIQGHHIGLQRGSIDALRELSPAGLAHRHPLGLRLTDPDPAVLKSRADTDGLRFEKLKHFIVNPREMFGKRIADMLDVRILYSCLVDADFLDTEAHFNGNEQGKCYREKGLPLAAEGGLAALNHYMAASVRANAKADQK